MSRRSKKPPKDSARRVAPKVPAESAEPAAPKTPAPVGTAPVVEREPLPSDVLHPHEESRAVPARDERVVDAASGLPSDVLKPNRPDAYLAHGSTSGAASADVPPPRDPNEIIPGEHHTSDAGGGDVHGTAGTRTAGPHAGDDAHGAAPDEDAPLIDAKKIKRILLGAPKDFRDRSVFHSLTLIPFLAWVGLGADGLSSSSYGPEEAFRTLGEHTYLALLLAVVMAGTVFVISAAYSAIIEEFPGGGGGYVVATKLLGERLGLVSGCALLVDYVLTITVSLAAAGDALWSLVGLHWQFLKFPGEIGFIVLLVILNLRGVKESVVALVPVFILFLITHALIIFGGIALHIPEAGATLHAASTQFHGGLTTLGISGMILLFVHAYSLGGGTYTGIEAVSNSLPLMREPRVETAKRTMLYMSISLAVTASGLILCYLLWHIVPVSGKTMNAVLAEKFFGDTAFGHFALILTLLTEGALLVVAAQAGFISGPRVLASMAVDSWVPHRFSALSERLTTENGILLMGVASLAALVYTRGNVSHLVVMYSINVFLTFSLSTFGMARLWWRTRHAKAHWRRRFALFLSAFLLCATILGVTTIEKFTEGGWMTVLVTGALILLCFWTRAHYRKVSVRLRRFYADLAHVPETSRATPPFDPKKPTAVVLVAYYSGLGIHTVLNIFRIFPGHFKNLVFVSVGVIDSGGFKGEGAVEALREQTESTVAKFVDLARRIGIPARAKIALGTDSLQEAERLCVEVAQEIPNCTFFAGKIVFRDEKWYERALHNEVALSLQKRLQYEGLPLVVLPARVGH